MSTKNKSNSNELALIFDIGSGSVGSAFTHLGSSPKVLESARVEIKKSDENDFDKFLSETNKALQKVADMIHQKRPPMPSRIQVSLASPWIASQARIIKYSQKSFFFFTEKFLSELIAKEVSNFEDEISNNYGKKGNKMFLIERSTQAVKLNGYHTSLPFGKKARTCEVKILLSIAPKKILDLFEYTIKKFFHQKVHFSSFSLASFISAREVAKDKENFILVDIAGEMTDIALVKDYVIMETISFPIGKNFLISSIELALGKGALAAETVFHMHLENKLHKHDYARVEKIVLEARNKWLSFFSEKVSSFSGDLPLPHDVYITTDADTEKIFKQAILSEEFAQHFLSEKKFNVIILNNKSIGRLYRFT